jgi:DnaJ-class molecular chaperone
MKVDCFFCDGVGWFQGKRIVDGREYNYARPCKTCEGNGKVTPMDNHPTLPLDGIGQLFEEREEAKRTQTREELEDAMRKPIANISSSAGEIERNSPLFYGTGDNPTLF